MGGRDDDFDWDDIRAGHLDEGEHDDPLGLKNGRGQSGPGYALRLRLSPRGRRVGPAPAASPGPAGPGRSAKLGASARQGLAPFHFAHSFVSRPRSWSAPRDVEKGLRKIVYPAKADVALLRGVPEARYHNRHHCWTLPRGHAFLQAGRGLGMNGAHRAVANRRRRNGQGVMKAANAPQRFQDYIERASAAEARRAEAIEHDRDGPISVGNLGGTRAERQAFWAAVERAERRVDARLQCRIIAEMPHWLTPEARRGIVEALGAEIGARGLGWWAAAHRPDVAKGSDPRNFHLHVGYHDRPVVGRSVAFVPDADGRPRARRLGPLFAERKDREARGEAWVVALKRRFAEIVNAAIDAHEAATGRTPPYRYFPGSYAELGIRAEGQRHLGPRRTALERAGILTHNGEINLDRSERAESAAYLRARRALLLAVRQAELWAFPADGSALARLHGRLREAIARDLAAISERFAEACGYEAAAMLPMGDPQARETADALLARREARGVPATATGRTRVERRAAELDALAARAQGDPEALATIARRRAELVEAEGGLGPAEAGRRRRAIEDAMDDARRRFVERSRLLVGDVEAAAAARLAASFAATLAGWRAWAARRARPTPGEALPPGPVLNGDHPWARRVPPAPPAAAEDGRDEDWKRVRRRLDADERQARQFAARFAGNRGLAGALLADAGVDIAGLGDAFAALQGPALARFDIRDRGRER